MTMSTQGGLVERAGVYTALIEERAGVGTQETHSFKGVREGGVYYYLFEDAKMLARVMLKSRTSM